MAAWNYQSILLCAIPVVEGLLPEPHNSMVLDVLFTLADWHSLAKLKLHTDTTVDLLRAATKELGRMLRFFKNYTCSAFATKELPSEEAARGRRQAKQASKGKGKGRAAPPKTSVKGKEYSLRTYKHHSLGDYVRTILWFGTSDSYSTQPGELEHRRVKRFYARTNKNRAVRQMTLLERRKTSLLGISARAGLKTRLLSKTIPTPNFQGHGRKSTTTTHISFAESEALPYTTPEQHYHISTSRNESYHLPSWLAKHRGDPAVKDFLPKLQEHLLGRLSHPEWTGDGNEFSPEQRFQLTLKGQRMYVHKIVRVNYTSYDVRRGQDCLNPRTHSDIMTLAPEDDKTHPVAYAKIIGIFHGDIVNTAAGADPTPHAMDFLWVRRYRLDPTWRGGFKRKRLFRLEFLPESDPDAFGFLNPDEVIRGSHIIPAFAYGTSAELLESGSIGHTPAGIRSGLTEDEDWRYHYVNIFVDRDMYMRYRGGGVGHYQVPLPPEEDDPPADEEDPEVPSVMTLLKESAAPAVPPETPPPSPPASRPGSAQSHNSDDSGHVRSPHASDSDSDESDEDPDEVEVDGSEDEELGPEGDEGYAPL